MDRKALIAAMQATSVQTPIPITVPGWGVVHIRPLTVGEVSRQEETADKDDKDGLARAAARLLCDEAGKRLFDPANPVDVKLISDQPWPLLQRILNASDQQIKGNAEGN